MLLSSNNAIFLSHFLNFLVQIVPNLEESQRFEESKTEFREEKLFPLFSWGVLRKLVLFWGLNGTTHEIDGKERADFSLSDGAKQNSLRSTVQELWCFYSFFIFDIFLIFSNNQYFSLMPILGPMSRLGASHSKSFEYSSTLFK